MFRRCLKVGLPTFAILWIIPLRIIVNNVLKIISTKDEENYNNDDECHKSDDKMIGAEQYEELQRLWQQQGMRPF